MKILKELGLSLKESEVYTTLLKTGGSNIQDLVSITSLKRPTVYLSLEQLKQKGIIHTELIKNKKIYLPNKPGNLLLLLKKQKKELDQKEKELLKLIPRLEASFKNESSQNNIKIYEGNQALWTISEELLKSHADFLFIYSGDSLLKHTTFEEILENFTKRRRQIHSSKLFAITDENSLSLRKNREGDTLFREIRFTPKKINLEALLCVCGSKICLVSLETNPQGIIIENKAIAKLIEFMFWQIWESLKQKTLT